MLPQPAPHDKECEKGSMIEFNTVGRSPAGRTLDPRQDTWHLRLNDHRLLSSEITENL